MVVCHESEGVAPGYYLVVPSRHQSACGVQSVVGYHPEDRCLFLFIALRWMQRPERVMVGLTEKYPSLLEDFQTGTSSMARKRHLASTARGLLCFCLMTLVTTGLIRSIRPIRGRKGIQEDRCLSLFIALRWMQRPERVMVGLTENIQACLRIFRRPQHQWLARDILHQAQGVFDVFVLLPASTS